MRLGLREGVILMESFQSFLDHIDIDQLSDSVMNDSEADVRLSQIALGGERPESSSLQDARMASAFATPTVLGILGLYHEWLCVQLEQRG